MVRPDPTGWTVAIEHPQTGRVHTPEVTGSPSRQPTANELPTVDIPIAGNAKWLHPDWEAGASMDVWVDGHLQPLDFLESVSHSESETTLSAEGGHELKARCQRDVGLRTTHGLAEELIQNRTPYEAVVTAPEPNREDGVVIADWSDGTILAENCPGANDPREPITVADDGDALVTQQVAYSKDGVLHEIDSAADTGTIDGAQYSSGIAASLQQEGDRLRYAITPDHDIPAEDVGLAVRDRAASYSNVAYSWSGARIDEQHNEATPLEWREMGQDRAYAPGMGYAASVGSALEAGEEYVFDIEVLSGGADYAVDCVALHDLRFQNALDFPNPGHENNGDPLAGPQHYPADYDARFTPVETIRSVAGGTATVGRSAGSTDRLLLSATRGEDYELAAGDSIHVDSFAGGPGPSLSTVVSLGRTGQDYNRGVLPAEGFAPQRLGHLQLRAALVDTPITVDRSFDGQLHEVLTTLAEAADSIWEYRRGADGQGQVVWTQAGRSPVPSRRAPDATSFSLDKSVGTTIDTAVVYGSTRSVSGERVGADHGTPQSLAHDRIQRGSVSVSHGRTGTQFSEGDDYTLDYEDGTLTAVAAGRIADGAPLAVSYSYQTRGEYTNAIPGPTEPAVKDIAGINSNYAAGQAARLIVEERQREHLAGQLVIPARDTGFSVVEYLHPEDLPIGEGGRTGTTAGLSALDIRSITITPTQTTLRLGNRRSVAEIVSDISNRVSAASRQT